MFALGIGLGIAIGGATVIAAWFYVDLGYLRDRRSASRRGSLPPATARQLRRATRDGRADLRTVSLRIVRPPSREDD